MRFLELTFLRRSTKRLSSAINSAHARLVFCRPEGRPTCESFAFSGTLRCAYDALRFGFTRLATKQSVRRDQVARPYGVSGSLFD